MTAAAFSQQIVHRLWQGYLANSLHAQRVMQGLQRRGIAAWPLDHFAMIDLPSQHSGIPALRQLFSLLSFELRGEDYLPDKQNPFAWMAATHNDFASAHDALPQIVIADFKLDVMPQAIRDIVHTYASKAHPPPIAAITHLLRQENAQARAQASHLITTYLAGRDWPLPTCRAFHTVNEYNELLAWVLVFGRRPNHFTVATHLLNDFENFADFIRFVTEELQLPLQGTIQGNTLQKLEQAATPGTVRQIALADGEVTLRDHFIEFIWRHPHHIEKQVLWRDFFSGFIAQQANRVVESLYTEKNQ